MYTEEQHTEEQHTEERHTEEREPETTPGVIHVHPWLKSVFSKI
jgi:hypothetical protein